MNYNYRIPHVFVQNPNVDGYDIATYAYLSFASYNYLQEDSFVSPICIAYSLFKKEPHAKVQYIRTSLQKIAEFYPDIVKQIDKNLFRVKYNCNYDSYKEQAIRFVYLSKTEINTIIDSSYSYNMSLLKCFAFIVSSFSGQITVDNAKYFATAYAASWFKTYLNISTTTYTKYLNCLQKLELIYVIGDIDKTNVIGRTGHQGLIRKWASLNGYAINFNKVSNERRSMTQKYNRILKLYTTHQSIPYSQDELKAIYQYLSEKNEKIDAMSPYVPNAELKKYDLSMLTSIITSKEELCETEQKAI